MQNAYRDALADSYLGGHAFANDRQRSGDSDIHMPHADCVRVADASAATTDRVCDGEDDSQRVT